MSKKEWHYLIAVDDGAPAQAAFEYLVEHSTPDDHISVVTGIGKRMPHLTPEVATDSEKLEAEKKRTKDWNQHAKHKGQQTLEKYKQLCAKANRQCTFSTIKYRDSGGSASFGEELCRTAAAAKADTVFVGFRGLSSIKRMVIGSVSDYAVRNCPCTVTVVKKHP